MLSTNSKKEINVVDTRLNDNVTKRKISWIGKNPGKRKLEKQRKENIINNYCNIPLGVHLIYFLMFFVIGAISWHFQLKINGWCP